MLDIEARAVLDLKPVWMRTIRRAVTLLYECQGKVVISGMGKSGAHRTKIAATLASTGTPSFFCIRPKESTATWACSHGVMCSSPFPTAETQEVLQLLPFVKRMNMPAVGMTGKMNSTLSKNSDVTWMSPLMKKPARWAWSDRQHDRHPRDGDVLAVALLQNAGSSMTISRNSSRRQPGAAFARQGARSHATWRSFARVRADVSGADTILEMTSKKLGLTTVVDAKGSRYTES